MSEETLNVLVDIAKKNGLIYHKLSADPNKYYFSTGYVTWTETNKPFHGHSFNLYETKFHELCKSLKLIN